MEFARVAHGRVQISAKKVLLHCVKPKQEPLHGDIPNLDLEKDIELHDVERSGRKLGHR